MLAFIIEKLGVLQKERNKNAQQNKRMVPKKAVYQKKASFAQLTEAQRKVYWKT